MDKSKAFALKWHLEGLLLSKIEEAILEINEIPEVMHRVIVIQTTEDFCQAMKNNFSILKNEFENENIRICFTIPEFNQIIDDVASQMLYLLTE